ncbi:MAG TPA: ribonuclease PH [Candidatus Hydrogenedentes bacterium]|nr:ribonuclease PH [Candidatus Hydrogenedentota bacterium]HQH53348.1 ribonuclease PH [Candidatus Hydrogenedentota bacterium]
MRPDNRQKDELRPVTFQRQYTRYAEGAVLVAFGETKVVCTATVEDRVPPFLRETNTGWITAEYAMLPRSTHTRTSRDSLSSGRAKEISRLIGRSLRNVVDLSFLGERQVIMDCDVLQADGGTRTAAVTGAYVALHDAIHSLLDQGTITTSPLLGQCAAVSVGLVDGEARLDLCYEEDAAADVDMNIVCRSDGNLIEVQATAEGEPFPRQRLESLLELAYTGCERLFALQREALQIA